MAVTDLGQPVSQTGQRVCLVGLDGFFKGGPGFVGLDLGQVGKPQYGLGSGEVRCQRGRFLCRLQGLVQFAERELDFGQAGMGQCVVG